MNFTKDSLAATAITSQCWCNSNWEPSENHQHFIIVRHIRALQHVLFNHSTSFYQGTGMSPAVWRRRLACDPVNPGPSSASISARYSRGRWLTGASCWLWRPRRSVSHQKQEYASLSSDWTGPCMERQTHWRCRQRTPPFGGSVTCWLDGFRRCQKGTRRRRKPIPKP